MKKRHGSALSLEKIYKSVHATILTNQDPVTGLIASTGINRQHAWVRDNIYAILSVWGLSMAYKKSVLDEDKAKRFELEQSCVKLMRALMQCMMHQREKVERFKETQNPKDCLHAKYSSITGLTVVSDSEWGHLQIDATSLYLLILAQMTASGLQIVYSLDEVAFIQNLVFYIEGAYCINDYGIWERGDKSNKGLPELNASSIGMAKAALEALNELDLFGSRGGSMSTIHTLADEAQKCQTVLQSMLPRESLSKEVDAGLLSIIGFPAFALDNEDLITLTRDTITQKLMGRYGCKRFLRDGYLTAKEDSNRLHYESWELKVFDDIEGEWPLFFCYLTLDYLFREDIKMVDYYGVALNDLLIKTPEGDKLVPQLYSLPKEVIEQELAAPHSQDRKPEGKLPYVWAQSLYFLGKLLRNDFLAPGELDPLNRRLGTQKKPDVVIQVVCLAENIGIQRKLYPFDIRLQTVSDVHPVRVLPARVLSHLYTHLGRSKKLGLTGRKSRDVGVLSTSKLYSLHNQIYAFAPQNSDHSSFYLVSDHDFRIFTINTNLSILCKTWRESGRPVVIVVLNDTILDLNGSVPQSVVSTIKKLKSGYFAGARIAFGNISEFLHTSCITSLNFLNDWENGNPDDLPSHIQEYLDSETSRMIMSYLSSHTLDVITHLSPTAASSIEHIIPRLDTIDSEELPEYQRVDPASRKTSVWGIVKRSRNIFHEREHGADIRTMSNFPSLESQNTMQSVTSVASAADSIDSTATQGTTLTIDSIQSRMLSLRKERSLQFGNVDEHELLDELRMTSDIEEEADILQYFYDKRGPEWNTGLAPLPNQKPATVRALQKRLYDKACHNKNWGIVRHVAGLLDKQVEDLAKALTDLLVRQKQVAVGIPPMNEIPITRALPSGVLHKLIKDVYDQDKSSAMLTQELLVYLAMFIRTEPSLFVEMWRLRIGLIIQVMAAELSYTLRVTKDEAAESLLSLSPNEMKNLLHHILSGVEFRIKGYQSRRGMSVVTMGHVKYGALTDQQELNELEYFTDAARNHSRRPSATSLRVSESDSGTLGHWLRRRRLDGALNRTPAGFYPRIWMLLDCTKGIEIGGKVVPRQLIQEMTAGELKFGLQVETVLNAYPEPEFRQLIVESLLILTLIVEHNFVQDTNGVLVNSEAIVYEANKIFLEDQAKVDGDATICCAREPNNPTSDPCRGAGGICVHFYDSAPSGAYGTMSYMMRAAATIYSLDSGELDCAVS